MRCSNRRIELGALLLIMLVAAGLRIVHARGQALWGDEIFSLAMATGHSLEGTRETWDPAQGDFVEFETPTNAEALRRYLEHSSPLESPGRVVRAVTISDTSPPLYYLSLWLWSSVAGTRDFVLRCHSIVWALAAIPLLWSIARSVGNARVAILTCTLFAVLPLTIDVSIEVRMYSMLWFWAAGLCAIAIRSRHTLKPLYHLSALVILSAAGLLTHYFFLFVICSVWLTLIICPGRMSRTRLMIAFACSIALIAPWYSQLPEMVRIWRVTKDWLANTAVVGEDSYRYAFYTVRNSFLAFYGANPPVVWTKSLYALTFLYLTAFLLLFNRLQRVYWLLLIGWWVFPAVGPMAVDALLHTYAASVPRYGYAGVLPALLIGSVACDLLLGRISLAALIALVLAYVPALHYLFVTSTRGSYFPPAAQMIDAESGPNDLIIVHSIPSGFLGIARYSKSATPMVLWTQQLRRHESRDDPDHALEDTEQLVSGRRQVLFVRVHDVSEPSPELDALYSIGNPIFTKNPGSSQVYLFRPAAGDTFAASVSKP